MRQKIVFNCKKAWVTVLVLCMVLTGLVPVSGAAADETSGGVSDEVSDEASGGVSDEISGETSDEVSDTLVIITEEGSQEYPLAVNCLTWNGKSYQEGITPQEINGVWMAPVHNVLAAILDCYVGWNDDGDTLTLKSPSREYSMELKLNSNEAELNGVAYSMPAPVLSGSLKSSDETEFFVPMDFVLGNLGFGVSMENGEIYITYTDYIYYMHSDTIDFDSSVYENALESVLIKKNGSTEYVRGITCLPIAKKSVSVSAVAREYQVTMVLAKTKNAVGEVDKKFTGGIIKRLQVWETEEYATCIAVTYKKKYIYSKKILSDGAQISLSKGSFALKVILPDGVRYSKITTTDQYWKNKFLIVIPGNYTSFYQEYAPVKNATGIKNVAVAKTAEGNTKITVTTKKLRGYKLTEGDGFFTVAIGSPTSIYSNIVMLDAGHGGKDKGATSNGLKEKALNLRILYTYAKSYFDSLDSTVKAYWTRYNDTFINLYERPKYSKTYGADLFVSLHMNSASSKSANGTEVYYSSNNNGKSFSGLTSKTFATRIKNVLVDGLNNNDRGVKQAGFVVIKYNTVPAILVELGFLTGSSDHKRLAKTTYQKKSAKLLYEGIADTFKKYPTGR